MKRYYIADTHFNHANILRFDNRPFANTKEMEEVIVKNWNDRVTADDIVYILGDFCWSLEDEWIRILDRLNGRKMLILGNHDLKRLSERAKQKFIQVTDYKEIKDEGKHIIMCHYPILFYKSSYGENVWHFCGHTHNRTEEEIQRQKFVKEILANRTEDYHNKGHIINVGCMMDYMGYTPRTADELIEWWEGYYGTAS
jgi:calcineurin-like phosphoesterase family protein